MSKKKNVEFSNLYNALCVEKFVSARRTFPRVREDRARQMRAGTDGTLLLSARVRWALGARGAQWI